MSRSIKFDIPVVEQDNLEERETRVLEVSVSYSMGGPNYFSGGHDRRGYSVTVTPTVVETPAPGSRFGSRSFMAFTGTRLFLEEAPRFSAKRLEALARTVRQHPRYDEVLAYVCSKNDLTLATASEDKVAS